MTVIGDLGHRYLAPAAPRPLPAGFEIRSKMCEKAGQVQVSYLLILTPIHKETVPHDRHKIRQLRVWVGRGLRRNIPMVSENRTVLKPVFPE